MRILLRQIALLVLLFVAFRDHIIQLRLHCTHHKRVHDPIKGWTEK